MTTTAKEVPPRSKRSFYESAAWISLFIMGCVAATIGAQSFLHLFEGETLGTVESFWFFGSVISFILGIISLLGFRQHRRKLTLWIALAGVLVSGGLAVAEVIFFLMLLSGMGHQ